MISDSMPSGFQYDAFQDDAFQNAAPAPAVTATQLLRTWAGTGWGFPDQPVNRLTQPPLGRQGNTTQLVIPHEARRSSRERAMRKSSRGGYRYGNAG